MHPYYLLLKNTAIKARQILHIFISTLMASKMRGPKTILADHAFFDWLPEVAKLRLSSTLLFAHFTVAGEGYISADPAVRHGSVRVTGRHDLLARQVPVGPAQALLVGAHAAAVTESPLEDVL